MTGCFISLDGVDGSGKSTQVRLLCQWLESMGKEVVSLRDPGGTELGEALRGILLHRKEIPLAMTSEMLLYMASRAQMVHEVILPALQRGTHVISDRYLLANVVYQGHAGGLSSDAIWTVGAIATAGLMPNLTVVLDLDPKLAYGRMQGELDRLESRGLAYMERVRAGFLNECNRLGEKAMVIDSGQPIELIHEQIVEAILSMKILEQSSNQ